MNEKQKTQTSKFLSLVLRHEPERIGIQLDVNGWVEVQALLAGCRLHGKLLERAQLEEIVATNEKKRFAFSDDGLKIRASQGHSVEVELGYEPQTPPQRLFHGTTTRFIESIRAEGLRKAQRHHVHLSPDEETARNVGQRHGKPVILTIHAEEMHARGHRFFISENGVWLTDHVPMEFIEFPNALDEAPVQQIGKRSSRSHLAKETVEICKAGHYIASGGAQVELGAIIQAAVSGTKCYTPESVPQRSDRGLGYLSKLEVTAETTLAALQRLHSTPGGHLACLNFASAKNAGGGFLGGAEAQEESLARSSALYPCLLAAPEYYERNRACRTTLYLDQIIWSPDIPFFRDDNGGLLDEPFQASVITAPAPNLGAVITNEPARKDEVEPTLQRRAAFVLTIAATHGVRRLVLGAWGCGVFRNDPRMVAKVFRELLCEPGEYSGVFDEVLFAIYDRSAGQSVLRAFEEAFTKIAVRDS